MTENPSTISPATTLPHLARMQRWIGTLRSLLTRTIEPADPAALENALLASRSSNRLFIVNCLRAVHALRAGVALQLDLPLAAMPLPLPASQGSRATELVWLAYVQFVQHKPTAAAWLAEACAALSPTGLKATPADNPEPWWQNEMLLLHALHSYALLSGDGASLEKTLACADFHVREIQPDHATNEPWAVHAYASHPDGSITGETLLHSAQIQNAGTLSEVAQLIVTDAAFALEAAARA